MDDDAEQATVADGVAGRSRGALHPSALPEPSSGTLTSTLALQEEQTSRSRGLAMAAIVVSVAVLAGIQVPEQRPPGYWPAVGALGAVVLSGIALLVASRSRSVVDERWITAFGLVCSASVLATAWLVGVFSPIVTSGFLLVFFFGTGDSQLGAWSVFLFSALGYALLSGLAVAGSIWVSDAYLPLRDVDQMFVALLGVGLDALFVLVFWAAQYSRRATLRAMERLERAQRRTRQREALLNEARADLDRALEAGRLGRFTGCEIGPWLADEVIGRGGMGEVYQARNVETGERAALKVLHRHLVDEAMSIERFFRESRASSRLDSPHIVRVLAAGDAPDRSPYLAMELLEGRDLGAVLRDQTRLDLEEVLELVAQVAAGLAAAEDAGIVHRDLKPQNVFLLDAPQSASKSPRGKRAGRTWKILDFGVSKISDAAATLTQGAIVGTPSYMSPEQARGEDVDARTDVFALGAIAYRALTGRPAFTGPDVATTIDNVLHKQPARPGESASISADVERVLALALAKQRKRRFPSARTFASALADAARGKLDERFRSAADEVLAAEPWGAHALEPRG